VGNHQRFDVATSIGFIKEMNRREGRNLGFVGKGGEGR